MVRIQRRSEPGLYGLCARIWNWREATAKITKWERFGFWDWINLTPSILEGEYMGAKIGYWMKESWFEDPKEIWQSSTDVTVAIREPPLISHIRIVFTFDGEEEFDYTTWFYWKPWKTFHGNVFDVEGTFHPTDRHTINWIKFYFTDNKEIKFTQNPNSWGRVIVIQAR